MARRVDHLGLRSALSDRLLPILVGAMSFLAALAVGGAVAASVLAVEWQGDTGAALTVQVPQPTDPAVLPKPGPTREAAVLAMLDKNPKISGARALSGKELDQLLAPWLGADVDRLALPVPAVITASWAGPGAPDALRAALDTVAPGTLAETGARWAARVAALTSSLQACAASVLVIVALVASAVIAVAIRGGLAQRRDAIAIIHGLGALDSDIADRFAWQATVLAAAGSAIGAACALPVLVWLGRLAAPFGGIAPQAGGPDLPASLWVALPAVPVLAAVIGWVTTQFTVRGWLRRLT